MARVSTVSSVVFRVIVLTVLSIGTAKAASERIVNYVYDDAGNIISQSTVEQSGPPVIDSLTPGFINAGRSITVVARGENLASATVTTSVSGLIASVRSTSLNEVTLTLSAAADVVLGGADIEFRNGLGATSSAILVAEAPPLLAARPSPIAIQSGGVETLVGLEFSLPRLEPESFSITLGDPSVATSASTTLNIGAGETRIDLPLVGLSSGVTTLRLELLEKFLRYDFLVFVSPPFAQTDERNFFSNRVGVKILPVDQLIAPDAHYSASVGVVVGGDNALQALSALVGVNVGAPGLAVSPLTGVFVGSGSMAQQAFSPLTGVFVGSSSSAQQAFSALVGAVFGAHATTLTPDVVEPDTAIDLVVTGSGLDAVDTVSVMPVAAVSVLSFTPDSSGEQLTISIDVDAAATPGAYRLRLQTLGEELPQVSGNGLVFEIQ